MPEFRSQFTGAEIDAAIARVNSGALSERVVRVVRTPVIQLDTERPAGVNLTNYIGPAVLDKAFKIDFSCADSGFTTQHSVAATTEYPAWEHTFLSQPMQPEASPCISVSYIPDTYTLKVVDLTGLGLDWKTALVVYYIAEA